MTSVKAKWILFVERFKVFFKFHSTQVIAFFTSLVALWAAMPDDMKQAVYDAVPFLVKYKSEIWIVGFVFAFYKTRMNTQAVPRTDIALKAELAAAPAAIDETQPLPLTQGEKTVLEASAVAVPPSTGG